MEQPPVDLVERAARGNEAAMERLLEIVWPEAYCIALAIVREPTCAQDAAQDACASAYTMLRTLRTPGAFVGWFYRIIVRASTSIAKTRQRELSGDAVIPNSPGISTADALDLRAALGALSIDARTAIILRYYANLNSSEIGRVLGVPAVTIRFRLAVAKRRLRTLLGEDKPTMLHSTAEG